MKKIISTIIAFFMLSKLSAFAYSDISDEQLMSKIEILSKYNIISGYEDGTFRPHNNITRAEFCKLIMCATMNDGIETKGNSFSDVSDDFWAKEYICAAKNLGVVNGITVTTFEPEANITNEQAVKMIVCSLGYGDEAVSAGGYPDGYIKIAKDLGIIADNFNTGSISTRQDVAEMIYNILDVEYYFVFLTEEGNIEKSKSGSTLREFYEFLNDSNDEFVPEEDAVG